MVYQCHASNVKYLFGAGGCKNNKLMKMFCLWLVNQLFALTIIVFILGLLALGAVLDPSYSSRGGFIKYIPTTVWVVAAIVGLIPAILTARFAKANFDEMISSGFMRWTSTISLWKSEWKFFFKTLFLGWLFYSIIVFFIELILGALFGFF